MSHSIDGRRAGRRVLLAAALAGALAGLAGGIMLDLRSAPPAWLGPEVESLAQENVALRREIARLWVEIRTREEAPARADSATADTLEAER